MATIVEVNPNSTFSIATTTRCRGGATPFPGLLYFTLDPYLKMLSVKQGDIKYHFKVFGMTRPGIERRSPGPLANTLTARPMSGIYVYIYQREREKREREGLLSEKMDIATLVEILDGTASNSLRANTLGKCMYLSILY